MLEKILSVLLFIVLVLGAFHTIRAFYHCLKFVFLVCLNGYTQTVADAHTGYVYELESKLTRARAANPDNQLGWTTPIGQSGSPVNSIRWSGPVGQMSAERQAMYDNLRTQSLTEQSAEIGGDA